MKKVAILGSTGSIGTQAMDVIEKSDYLSVTTLAAYGNAALMEAQIRKVSPAVAALYDEKAAADLRARVSDTNTKVLGGAEGVCEAAAFSGNDIVLVAVSGSIGIKPTLCAIDEGKDIALANKETMVCAGDIVNDRARKNKVRILPVDSEHSAVFQCIRDEGKSVGKIILTASGGPFFGKTRGELQNVTPKDALKNPNWDMGAKITIDSATLFNKGLEVIEAVRLFGAAPSQIEVLVHRQSIIHSMVEFCDGSVLAQLGMPDMRLPISYALHYPERRQSPAPRIDFTKIGTLTFEKPDTETFPGLAMGFEAVEKGGTMPAVYNAANEEAVSAFLNGGCAFLDIPKLVRRTMENHKTIINPSLEDIIESDMEARRFVKSNLERT